MNIPFINKCFIPECKHDISDIQPTDHEYCNNKYYESLVELKYYHLTDYNGTQMIYINLDTPGILKLVVREYQYNSCPDNYMVISEISVIDNKCRKAYVFYLGRLEYTINKYDISDIKEDQKYKPDKQNDFIIDFNALPEELYDHNYSPYIIRLYNKSIKLHKQLLTFHLCLYRKMTDKNTRLHILSYIYG